MLSWPAVRCCWVPCWISSSPMAPSWTSKSTWRAQATRQAAKYPGVQATQQQQLLAAAWWMLLQWDPIPRQLSCSSAPSWHHQCQKTCWVGPGVANAGSFLPSARCRRQCTLRRQFESRAACVTCKHAMFVLTCRPVISRAGPCNAFQIEPLLLR